MAKYMTKREAMRKRAWFRALSGLADFFASIGSVIVILLCVALLTQLFVWLRSDIAQTFYSLESVAISAIVQPETMKERESTNIIPQAQPIPPVETEADATVIPDDGEESEGEEGAESEGESEDEEE